MLSVGRTGFKVLLRAVGFLMAQASRQSPWMRNQINKDMVLEIGSADGVAHHLEFVRESRRITVDGNPALLLWFHGLTRIVVPIGRHRPRKKPFPGALVEPNPKSQVYGLVTREPVAEALDPQWTAAAVARATLVNLRAQTTEPVPYW